MLSWVVLPFRAVTDSTSCMHCGVLFGNAAPSEGPDGQLLCSQCGVYWLTYKEFRPLTSRQQGVANAKASERSALVAETLIAKLAEAQSGPVTPGSITALRLAALDNMMQCVVGLPRDDKTVLSLSLPPLPPFAYFPVSPHMTQLVLRGKLFGPDTATVLAGLPFVSFSTITAVKVLTWPCEPCLQSVLLFT